MRKIHLFGVVIVLFTIFMPAFGNSRLLVEGIELLLEKDAVFQSEESRNRDSLWQAVKAEYPKGNIPDTLLLDWTLRMGRILAEEGLHADIAPIFAQAIEYAETHPSPANTHYGISLKIGLGVMYQEMGLWSKALNLYLSLLEQQSELCSPIQYGDINNNIGNIYFKKGAYDKARLYYDSAIVTYQTVNAGQRLVNTYNNIAAIYYEQKDYKGVMHFLNRALALIDPDENFSVYYNIIQNIATVYHRQGKTIEAFSLIQEAMEHAETTSNPYELVETYQIAANILMKEKPETALNYLEKALEQTSHIDNIAQTISILSDISRIYTEKGQYKDACEIMKRALVMQDSLMRIDNLKRIESIEAVNSIEADIRLKELELKKAQIKQMTLRRHQTMLWVALLLLLIVSAFILYAYHVKKRNGRKNEELAKRIQQLRQMEHNQAEQKEKEYQEALELKNKELTTKVLHLVKNNEFIHNITKELQALLLELNPKMSSTKNHINNILAKLRTQGKEGTSAEFQYYFEQVHQNFYENLRKAYPNLTYKDLRLCAFLKLGLSSKEISAITYSETRSVESARNRLRKKINLSPEVNLIEFFSKF